jgi:hypothetical protein
MTFDAAYPQFAEGDVVMICSHIYGFGFTPGCANTKRVDPPGRFTREDTSTGFFNWLVCCYKCKGNKNADLVEMFWQSGKLHVSDFHHSSSTSETLGRDKSSIPPPVSKEQK